ncbi:HEXXH motif domain-containing protein [Streptomyces sp. NPDC001815]|uniref:HEXXH motif domain-containing protein n=1 Tax=Streptomyces sp. NPDC001815 TaxID=3154526 RepID=UPI0033269389
MGVDRGEAWHRPAFHNLSLQDLPALVHDSDHSGLVSKLLKAERSRRLLLLRAFIDRAAASTGAGEAAPVAEAWHLLEHAQHALPEAVEEVLMAPGTGIWLSSALRHLRDYSAGQPPLWAVTGHLSLLAVAAATRARLSFSLEVPACWGTVAFPGLGCATFAGMEPWATARVTGHDGSLCIAAAGTEIRVEPEWQRRAPGWLPTRRLVLGAQGSVLRLIVEEHDPYRTFSGPHAPRVMTQSEENMWRSSLTEAWGILVRDEPLVAEEMRSGALVSLAPAEPREKFRPYSSSAGEAFGGISASLPDSPSQLAATLVHEFQHIKLGALIHLEPLLYRAEKPDEREELLYAPWRDDPRPLEGVLQGIYAFFGVTRFWHAHRRNPGAAHSPLADFEFALCREQVWSTLNSVRRHPRLTPVGRRLLDALGEQCALWMAEEVPDKELRLTREVGSSHCARWRAHHLRPSSLAVDEAVRAWARGDRSPPALLGAPPRPVPDMGVDGLDIAAVLIRHRITDPEGGWIHQPGPQVSGAGRADVLLALGERSAAREILVRHLLAEKPSVDAWALLGRALADDPAQNAASRLLLRFPERARAVQEALQATGMEQADPVRLAGWLAEGADKG